jgi:hypothetical protein
MSILNLGSDAYFEHRISIPAYATEQQWWQSGVPKNLMSLVSLIIKNDAFSIAKRVTMWHYFKNYWHATKWSAISFSHWQCPWDGDFSFPRFVGLLILSLWFWIYVMLFQSSDTFHKEFVPSYISWWFFRCWYFWI